MAKFDAYLMPRVEELFDSIGSASAITTLDLAKGYWQILLAENRNRSRHLPPHLDCTNLKSCLFVCIMLLQLSRE